MTSEEALMAVLAAANTDAGTNIWPEVLPEEAEEQGFIPAIIISRVSTLFAKNIHQQYYGLQRARFQLDCWANLPREAATLAGQVIATLNNYQGNGITMVTPENDMNLPDPQTGLARRTIDVYVWHED